MVQFDRLASTAQQLVQQPGLPFVEFLDTEPFRTLLDDLDISYRERLYPPWVTLGMFLSQTLSADGSCQEAVLKAQAYRLAHNLPACSSRTGSYCEARQTLPQQLIRRLNREVTGTLLQNTQPDWQVHGRSLKVVDGTTLTLETSEANLRADPPGSNQHRSNLVPVMRLVVVFCLATGAVLERAFGPCQGKGSGEKSLFRQLFDTFEERDVVLGDRFFGDYRTIAELTCRQVDCVFRLSKSRSVDFRRGRRLGKGDHVVTWQRPAWSQAAMSREDDDRLPETMSVREVRVRVDVPGFLLVRAGDDVAGCGRVECRGVGRSVPAALAGGVELEELEKRDEPGSSALQKPGDGSKGTGVFSAELQPDSDVDARSGEGVWVLSSGVEFSGECADDEKFSGGGGVAIGSERRGGVRSHEKSDQRTPGGEPPGSSRTPKTPTKTKAIPLDERPAKTKTFSMLQKHKRLTKYHSAEGQ